MGKKKAGILALLLQQKISGGFLQVSGFRVVFDPDASGQHVVSITLDGGTAGSGTTDAEGLLTIHVSDGAHSIRLSDSQKDVYINNYAGPGLVEDALRSYPVMVSR